MSDFGSLLTERESILGIDAERYCSSSGLRWLVLQQRHKKSSGFRTVARLLKNLIVVIIKVTELYCYHRYMFIN